LRKTEARVSIRLKDGRTLDHHVEHALGTLARAMSDADIETKCRSLCAGIISASQTDELVRLCWSVAALPDAGAIARAAVPAA
jgi:2-methylcitrate dehydratase PrpD